MSPKLVDLLPTLHPEQVTQLYLLIAKGKSLFETDELESRRSFAELLAPCIDSGLIPDPLEKEVRAFANALLSPHEAGFLRIKSFIHSLVDVARYGQCRLKKDTIAFLDRQRPDVIRALPGYRPPDTTRPYGLGGRPGELNAKHCETVHRLLDHTAFHEFQFVRLSNAL